MADHGNCSFFSITNANCARFEPFPLLITFPAGCYSADTELANGGHFIGSKVTRDHLGSLLLRFRCYFNCRCLFSYNQRGSKRAFFGKLLKLDGDDKKGTGGSQSDGVAAPSPPDWDHMEHSVRQQQRLCGPAEPDPLPSRRRGTAAGTRRAASHARACKD